MLDRITDGRTDLVFEYLSEGQTANSKDKNGVSLMQWCAYYGDVSAIRFLLANGESLESLGKNFDLNGAAFHGHWQLCQFLVEQGADVNYPLTWGSWHQRPAFVLAMLCYGSFSIHPEAVKKSITERTPGWGGMEM
ncbi:MAG: ankyrin repeat domain-containing protein, partial [Bacteroidota bacterium]